MSGPKPLLVVIDDEEGILDVIAFIKSLTSDEREPGRP